MLGKSPGTSSSRYRVTGGSSHICPDRCASEVGKLQTHYKKMWLNVRSEWKWALDWEGEKSILLNASSN